MKNLWSKREAAKARDKLDLLVYSSRLIGSEPKLCVWGGGNTSTKTVEKDHRGKTRRVLRIKGSGSDLKVSTRADYPPVALDELLDVFQRDAMTDEAMVDYVMRSVLDPKSPRPSIEVLLHAFVDQPDIHHTHADAILSITNTTRGRRIAREIYGDELLWVPYVKPGFTLAKRVGEAYRRNPDAKGVILEKHGLITWGPDAKTSYGRTIEMVTRAEKCLERAQQKKKRWSPLGYKDLPPEAQKRWLLRFLPLIRKTVSRREGAVLTVTRNPAVMAFINARAAKQVSQVGPATPDHMLRTKRTPLYVELSGKNALGMTDAQLVRQIERYAKMHEAYFERHRRSLPNGPSARMLDPYPKVILVPGIGMITTGKDLKSARIVAEIYEHSISVMTAGSALDRYASLNEKLAFEMDYWPMELYKLSLAPPEAEFARKVGLITGAARGIGKACAWEMARRGAVVFLADLKREAVEREAQKINEACGKRAFAVGVDVRRPASVKSVFEKIILETGGLDFLVSNAGIAHVAAMDALELKQWDQSFAVNATGHFLVAREAVRLMKRQGTGGSLVFIASKNVLAPGKDFGAYSAAKAAEAQLARILAIENGEFGIRVNMVNPDGVFEDSGLWDAIRSNRARTYGVAANRLENYYVSRNLMKTRILPEDVAESVSFLISSRASKTTGCILTVDGGVKEAFPR